MDVEVEPASPDDLFEEDKEEGELAHENVTLESAYKSEPKIQVNELNTPTTRPSAFQKNKPALNSKATDPAQTDRSYNIDTDRVEDRPEGA